MAAIPQGGMLIPVAEHPVMGSQHRGISVAEARIPAHLTPSEHPGWLHLASPFGDAKRATV